MFKFQLVQEDVIIEDRKNRYCEMARNGLELDESGDYLVATDQNSKAEILAGGGIVNLRSRSYMLISRNRSRIGERYFTWTRDVKIFLGKIWSHIEVSGLGPKGAAAEIAEEAWLVLVFL
jgi:hypothetical protein